MFIPPVDLAFESVSSICSALGRETDFECNVDPKMFALLSVCGHHIVITLGISETTLGSEAEYIIGLLRANTPF